MAFQPAQLMKFKIHYGWVGEGWRGRGCTSPCENICVSSLHGMGGRLSRQGQVSLAVMGGDMRGVDGRGRREEVGRGTGNKLPDGTVCGSLGGRGVGLLACAASDKVQQPR